MPSSPPPSDSTLIGSDAPHRAALEHVLIVEDEEGLANLFREWIMGFYGADATAHVATTVADAEVTLSDQSDLDIVILDKRLPDGDGAELLPAIQSWTDAITVMVTGKPPDSDLIELGVADYLVKPIDEEDLPQRIALLKKLEVAGVLDQYSDARKASLLEYHLDDPDADPLFRRFANRWSYDRLEIAHVEDQQLIYGFYRGGADEDLSIAIEGELGPDLEDLLADEKIGLVGELVPVDNGYAWVDADRLASFDTDPDSISIYEFICETPERYITEITDMDRELPPREIREILELEFS